MKRFRTFSVLLGEIWLQLFKRKGHEKATKKIMLIELRWLNEFN